MTRAAVERMTVDGPVGALEAVVEDPGLPGDHYAIVCHPHPLFGGTMDNKVVVTLARAMHDAHIPTIRFNYRGVGMSRGTYDEGIGETADAFAVAADGASRWAGRQLIIAGFSFGCYVALRMAQRTLPARLVTVAPPVASFDFSGLETPRCPWLVVQGDADELVDARGVSAWIDRLEPRPQLLMMSGVGHFFHGRLHELRDAVRLAVGTTVRGESYPERPGS